jgi:hypothetical protein
MKQKQPNGLNVNSLLKRLINKITISLDVFNLYLFLWQQLYNQWEKRRHKEIGSENVQGNDYGLIMMVGNCVGSNIYWLQDSKL